ncbi:MAG: aminotransferase class V-fold PLP-dependent enzyme [Muribaculaceae bacterium]|nr:aminotransferase class V-fold PLP-dependent enzyme [Roseburia sp.]MCM1432013.1 aminotransferase class V-fold PLP-dependent enzyme [Muribaculaceae bacterium]MCM1493733.1 aminotransferase class V-fold PLP-dependent enzyme [Muribaculaceae bacterium]
MLNEELIKLAHSRVYPFHMPGHKRRGFSDFPSPYSLDITEIEGFDNLHHPLGILKEEQARAAAVYGSKQCYYLVNGSTCGLLAAISAAVRPGGRVLVARNCHKSVYNALYLRRLRPVYVYPAITRQGLQGQIRAEDIRQKLAEYKDIRAVVVTSPTYDGILSDVAAIAEETHRRGIPLIVDGAHGAHLGFHEAFPENAVRLGADAVVMSIHKTLPAFTQTALLHLCSDRLSAPETERFLGIYESSSPSYVLMAGISRCMELLSSPAVREQFSVYAQRLADFRERIQKLSHFKAPGAEDFTREEAFAFDPGKLIIDTSASGMTGARLKERLLTDYGLQTEMASGAYVLAMTSLMDSREGFDRLAAALEELDRKADVLPERDRDASAGETDRLTAAELYQRQFADMELWEALDAEQEIVPLSAAAGRSIADYLFLYPPGIPILAPGERMGEQTPALIERCRRMGLAVEGLAGADAIRVVKSRDMYYNIEDSTWA